MIFFVLSADGLFVDAENAHAHGVLTHIEFSDAAACLAVNRSAERGVCADGVVHGTCIRFGVLLKLIAVMAAADSFVAES